MRNAALLSSTLLLLPFLVASAAVEPAPTVVSLETGDPLYLVAPDKAGSLALVVDNPRDDAVQVRLSGTLSAWSGTSLPFAQELTIAGHGQGRIAMPAESHLGIHYVDYELAGTGATAAVVRAEHGQRSFVVGTPVAPGPDPAGFLYGVSSHPERGDNSDRVRELELLAAGRAGLRVMRLDANWGGIEPEPGGWRWDTLDRLVALGEAQGVQLEIMLGFGAKHAAGAPAKAAYAAAVAAKRPDAWLIPTRTAPEDAPWRNFIATITMRYRGRVHLWEVWNEPDLAGFFAGSTAEYIRMLRSAGEEIHHTDPTNRVLSGGFATVNDHGGRALNPDLQERVLAEASDAFDFHAYHGHGPFAQFKLSVEGELARIRRGMNAPRPLYFNETALTSTNTGERIQAIELVKKLTYVRASGAVGYTWYDLRNDGWDPNEGEHNYGLVLRDFRPKAAYAAAGAVISVLRGTKPTNALDLGTGRHAYAFAGSGRRVVIFWNETPGLGDEPIAIRAAGCTDARISDLMGNASALPQRDGAVLVHPTAEPKFLVLPGGETPPEVAGHLVALDGELYAAPGETLAVPVRLHNPLTTPLAIDLAYPEGDTTATRHVDLAPQGDSTVAFSVTSPADASWAKPTNLELHYQVVGGPWSGSVNAPIMTVQDISRAAIDGRAADFSAETYDHVVNFFDADPANVDKTWKGAADCSARIWLTRATTSLQVHVVVRDDHHAQPGPAGDSWRGDGLQVAFEIPGQKGFWELGAALGDDGAILRHVWIHPQGRELADDGYTVRATASADGMVYDLDLPDAAFGLSDELLARGIRFNLIVNDNDGGPRKGFVRVAPGIGERKDPSVFPLIRCRAAP